MTDPVPPRKLSPSEVDALPLRAWLRHRFGLGHRLALATIAVDLGLYASGLDIETAGNVVQGFVLLVLAPMSIIGFVYFVDAAVALGHRLGLTSQRSLYPRSDDSVVTAADSGRGLTSESSDVGTREVDAAERNRAAARVARRTVARKVLYVVGIPAGLAVIFSIILMTSGGRFEGGGAWMFIGILGLLLAVAPTIADWRQTADEPLPDLSGLDGRFADPPASELGLEPKGVASRPDTDRNDTR